jgi:hypothetical protein
LYEIWQVGRSIQHQTTENLLPISALTIEDLEVELVELRERYPQLAPADVFTAWFLKAYVTDNDNSAIEAVAGGAGDKGIDAVLIDENARAVFVIQTKYRETIGKKAESRNDVLGFASLAQTLSAEERESFAQLATTMEPHTRSLVTRARQRIKRDGYRLWLYYVTLGKVSPSLEKDAAALVGKAESNASIEILAGGRLLSLLRDYLDGAAPPIPTLDLEMEKSAAVTVNGIFQRYDKENEIESWVFSMRGSAVAELFNANGVRLFARNIRGFIGENTPVNRGMSTTLANEPDHFFYYNNGITIVCDRAEKRSGKGRDVLRVNNPQVINGQQTSRMLAAREGASNKATVLVKVIQVPRAGDGTSEPFDKLVSRIVQGTNWQNAIRPSDLMSNDRRQIDLERSLRKLGYAYLRKRQTKGEAKAQFRGKHYKLLKKEEIAQAVAGCELDPVVARSGKDHLFDEDLYPRIFGSADPDYYLSRYWLFYAVTYWAKGYPQRGYAKWLVLGFVWDHLEPFVRSARHARSFRTLSEKGDPELFRVLGVAISRTYSAASKYYNANKGSGDRSQDPSLFFRSKRGRRKEFAETWKRGRGRRLFEQRIRRAAELVDAYQE